jgi:hypothetical protein
MAAEDHTDQMPPDTVINRTSREETLAEFLDICDEFFRHATGIVHDELRYFPTSRGYHPHTCLGWFLDVLQFTAHNHRAATTPSPSAALRKSTNTPPDAQPQADI